MKFSVSKCISPSAGPMLLYCCEAPSCTSEQRGKGKNTTMVTVLNKTINAVLNQPKESITLTPEHYSTQTCASQLFNVLTDIFNI